MELVVHKIPPEFIKSIPKGFRLIKKNQSDFLLVESVFCPRGHNIIVDSVRIHDEASLKLKITINQANGFLFIDSYWGSHTKLFSFIPVLSTRESPYVSAFCPYCDADMNEQYVCPHEGCDSKRSLLLLLPGSKNRIHICAKLGCPGHKLEINDMPHQLIDSVSEINFFGAATDEVFGGI